MMIIKKHDIVFKQYLGLGRSEISCLLSRMLSLLLVTKTSGNLFFLFNSPSAVLNLRSIVISCGFRGIFCLSSSFLPLVNST